METVIGLDIGLKKTGIAKSDSMGLIIKPLKTIASENLISELQEINKEYQISLLVIGMPVNIKDGNKDAMKMVENKVQEIQQEFTGLEIEFIDESYTSKEAERIIKDKGIKIDKSNKSLIDSYAAAIILETYWNTD